MGWVEMWKFLPLKKVFLHDTAEKAVMARTHVPLITFLQMADFRKLISLISPWALVKFRSLTIKIYLHERLSLFYLIFLSAQITDV